MGGEFSREIDDTLARARCLALSMFARELCLEHLFCALMADESNAACRFLLERFADPASLAEEALATADGILVVGSAAALPFSTLGVQALFDARAAAGARGESQVDGVRLAMAALAAMPTALRAELAASGLGSEAFDRALPPAGAPWTARDDEALFRRFSPEGKKLLAVAARACQRAREPSISPARVLLAAIEIEPALAPIRSGHAEGLRRLASRSLVDPTPPPERELPWAADLTARVRALPQGAGTLELMFACASPPTSPLGQILARHRVAEDPLRSRGRDGEADGGLRCDELPRQGC